MSCQDELKLFDWPKLSVVAGLMFQKFDITILKVAAVYSVNGPKSTTGPTVWPTVWLDFVTHFGHIDIMLVSEISSLDLLRPNLEA